MSRGWTVLTPVVLGLLVLGALTVQGDKARASAEVSGAALKAAAQDRVIRPHYGGFDVDVIVEGYASTFDVDRADEAFAPGCRNSNGPIGSNSQRISASYQIEIVRPATSP